MTETWTWTLEVEPATVQALCFTASLCWVILGIGAALNRIADLVSPPDKFGSAARRGARRLVRAAAFALELAATAVAGPLVWFLVWLGRSGKEEAK